jgi:DNA primase
MVDETLIDNSDVLALINTYKNILREDPAKADKNYFIYHGDPRISSLAVSLLNIPYEESEHWRREFSQSGGYQSQLFEKNYEDFIRALAPDNSEELMNYLKTDEDKTNEEVESAINYLKLKKIRRMLLENQADMEKIHSKEEYAVLHQTHEHLKLMEREISSRLGTVIIK